MISFLFKHRRDTDVAEGRGQYLKLQYDAVRRKSRGGANCWARRRRPRWVHPCLVGPSLAPHAFASPSQALAQCTASELPPGSLLLENWDFGKIIFSRASCLHGLCSAQLMTRIPKFGEFGDKFWQIHTDWNYACGSNSAEHQHSFKTHAQVTCFT